MTLYDKLNAYLANQQVMYIKLHNMHWYIQGSSFFTLHAKFEQLYGHTAEVIDEVAERLLALGQRPVAGLRRALELASVKELDDCPVTREDAMHQLTTDVEYWISDTQEIVRLAEEAGDGATADQFNGYLAEYQKLLWMLRAYSA